MPDHQLLTPDAHRDLRIDTGRSAVLGDAQMCCIIVPDEFRRVQADYPILFRLNLERDGYNALAMFGLEQGENLFLDGDRWDAGYLPLAIDIQPFLIGGAPTDDAERKKILIDMASPRIAAKDGAGTRVFDDDGRPTPYLDRIAEKLGALDTGYRGAADFFAALRRYELLEPLALEIPQADGSVNRMVGFHVIDEQRVRQLDGGALGDLQAAGHLLPIFMAVASLGRIRDLVTRRQRRERHG